MIGWKGVVRVAGLMDMVDDATGRAQARMGQEETIWAAVGVLRAWIDKYGVPRTLYTDWKNVYKQKATPAGERSRRRSLGACVRSWG